MPEYNLYATRQMGAISGKMEVAKNQYAIPTNGTAKKETLAAAGIDIRRANEAEKLAAVPENRFTEVIARFKK